jgi:hypothetical protein
MNKRKLILRLNFKNGNYEESSKKELEQIFSNIKQEFDKKQQSIINTVSNGPSLDKTFRVFTNNFIKKVKSRFYRTPIEWPALKPMTIKERKYQKNPELFEREIYKFWPRYKKDEFPSMGFPNTMLGAATDVTPSLLRSGALSRCFNIYYDRKKAQKKVTGNTFVIQRYRTLRSEIKRFPYASLQFLGGIGTVFGLKKTTNKSDGSEGKQIYIPIPHAFLNTIKSNRKVLEEGGFRIEESKVNVPPRNPFFFDKDDINLFNNLLVRLSSDISNDLKSSVSGMNNSSSVNLQV